MRPAVVGFVGGLVTNFLLSKKLVFQAEEARVQVGGEFIGYAVIGLIGLGITMMLMYLLTDLCHLYFMAFQNYRHFYCVGLELSGS